MKEFFFTRIEFHGLNKYYESSLTEEELYEIFKEAEYGEEEFPEMIVALQDPDHFRNAEMQQVITESFIFNSNWEFVEDDLWTLEAADYEVEVSLDEVFDPEEELSSPNTLH